MKKDEMDNWLRSSLEGHESPIPMGGWKGLHATRKKKRRALYYWLLAASVCLFAGISFWQFDPAQPLAGTTEAASSKESVIPKESIAPSLENEAPGEASSIEAEQQTADQVQVPENYTETEEVTPKESISLVASEPKVESILTREEKFALIPTEPNPTLAAIAPLSIAAKPVKSIETVSVVPSAPQPYSSPRRIEPFAQPKWVFTLEASAAQGNVNFGKNSALASYYPLYSSIIKEQNLVHHTQSLGAGIYRQLSPRVWLGSGLNLNHSLTTGTVQYAYYESSLNLVPFGNQVWPDNTASEASSFSHKPDIKTWSIQIPLRLRYQLFMGHGPFAELSALYSYRMNSSGEWVSPDEFQVARRNDLVRKHSLSAELALGYQWKTKASTWAISYRFNPLRSYYQTNQGEMGTNLHGFSIQWQMPQ